MIGQDIINLEYMIENIDSWDKCSEIANTKVFDTWPSDRKIQSELKDNAKSIRDSIKKKFNDVTAFVRAYSSIEAYENIYSMYDILKAIESVILEFSEKFAARKREKNIVDFNDIEHFALRILSKKENNVVDRYKDKYEEILIDEYQDSNLVQEYILNIISRGNNIFMVGDVKQSIYKFRQARPELFLEKYETYKDKEELTENDNLKIQLFKNFRSRKNVLDITNIVFQNIMNKELGDIDYTETEYLNLGADYPDGKNINAELHIIDLKEEEESIYKEDTKEEEEAETEKIEDILIEAKFVARKIKELIDKGYMVCNKDKTYRKITYKDIAILLRSPSSLAPIYEQEISKLNMPVFCDVSVGYLDSIEINVMMSLLKIIDNPMNDIALVTVLRSMIGGFTDNELIQIRIENKNKTFYEAMCEYGKNTEITTNEDVAAISDRHIDNIEYDINLKNKIQNFLDKIQEFRDEKEYMPLDEFIWKIYLDTGYYNYVSLMPNGVLRVANLKILFEKAKQYEKTSFKGLYNFISFIDKLRLSNKDMSGAKLIGENDDVIRIMSIHKSKGLEFPVVFLSGTGKRFNIQDLNTNPILLHQDFRSWTKVYKL